MCAAVGLGRGSRAREYAPCPDTIVGYNEHVPSKFRSAQLSCSLTRIIKRLQEPNRNTGFFWSSAISANRLFSCCGLIRQCIFSVKAECHVGFACEQLLRGSDCRRHGIVLATSPPAPKGLYIIL